MAPSGLGLTAEAAVGHATHLHAGLEREHFTLARAVDHRVEPAHLHGLTDAKLALQRIHGVGVGEGLRVSVGQVPGSALDAPGGHRLRFRNAPVRQHRRVWSG
jgi:hypothetical protein